MVYTKCWQKQSPGKESWVERGGEKESVHFRMKYLRIGKLGSPVLGKAENCVIQKQQRYTKWGDALENVPRVQAKSSWHIYFEKQLFG